MTAALTRPHPQAAPGDKAIRPAVPPLRNGDHLSREEFHRRYEAMPEKTWAELIEGVAYLDRCEGDIDSARFRFDVVGWLGHYRLRTPELAAAANPSVLLDARNELQPAALMMTPASAGGTARVDGDGFVAGPPELVCEVRANAAAIDLHAKRRAYERNGVGESLVVVTEEQPPEVRWMSLVNGRFEPIAPDPADGLLKSRRFPGLWLDADALLGGDLPRLVAALDRGCATGAHAAFAARLGSVG